MTGPEIARETPADSPGWFNPVDPLGISGATANPLGGAESSAWNAMWDNYYRTAQAHYERNEAWQERRGRASITGGFIPSHIEFGVVSAEGFRRTGVVDASGSSSSVQAARLASRGARRRRRR